MYIRDRVQAALDNIKALRENQDCVIEAERLGSIAMMEFWDNIASAEAYLLQAVQETSNFRAA